MKKQFSTHSAPSAPGLLSQAIESHGLVFVAGQVHVDLENKLLGKDVEEKLEVIMKNIAEILKSAKLSLNNIVKATVYVTDMSIMPELNKAYPKYFSDPLPAREAVCVKELPLGADIEISVVATR